MHVLTKKSRNLTGGIKRGGAHYSPTYAPPIMLSNPYLDSCGPVVEQGTHFCDLSRYFGGDVDISTVTANSVDWDEEPGKLSKVPVDESNIPPERRIPRVTAATWYARIFRAINTSTCV